MKETIMHRIEVLEKKLAAADIPTFEQWVEQWGEFTDLDKALFINEAENLELIPDTSQLKKYVATVSGYLYQMGLIDENAKTLKQIAGEMEYERLQR